MLTLWQKFKSWLKMEGIEVDKVSPPERPPSGKMSEEKARRMLEKSMRMPINDVVLEVQKGFIDINDLFKRIEEKVKGVNQNG